MSDYIELIKSRNQAIERAEKAEAEVERLREALERLLLHFPRERLDTSWEREARCALAGKEES
jgi:hypothetical protein